MTEPPPLLPPSALNTTLQGSTGKFRIKSKQGNQTSLEVNYFITNVGLDLGSGSNDQLLSQLAPVREVFDVGSLGFEELMQRDIDDARVSGDLIPYLIEQRDSGLVKLFPPIVVVLLPVGPDGKSPGRLYPPIARTTAPGSAGYENVSIQSGKTGQESFRLTQPKVIELNRLLDHDQVRLEFNSHSCKLVIVDGQHRAMALLALFRNARDEWSDERRSAFKQFYAEWRSQEIEKYDLSGVQVPVMICVVPELDEDYTGDYDLIRAARKIFLDLNKNARKVSVSRNRLLDDTDLVSVFSRRLLDKIKSRDSNQDGAIQIWNVELDQVADRVAVNSKTALTGVNNIYYMLEQLMISDLSVDQGVTRSNDRLSTRTKIHASCIPRIDGSSVIGEDSMMAIRRNKFSSKQAHQLAGLFMERYGNQIIHLFDNFGPYRNFDEATASLQARLQADNQNRIRSLLFDGQGSYAVFEDHLDRLERRIKDPDPGIDVAHLKELRDNERNIEKSISAEVKGLDAAICNSLLDGAGLNEGAKASLRQTVTRLYSDVFRSVAFQTALASAFFGAWEAVTLLAPEHDAGPPPDSLSSELGRFEDQLSAFFQPTSPDNLARLLRCLVGATTVQEDSWSTTPSDVAFKQVVHRGEMQPDEFPKYRYLILEIWKPDSESLVQHVDTQRTQCRSQVVKSLADLLQRDRAREEQRAVSALEDGVVAELTQEAIRRLTTFVQNVNGTVLNEATLRADLSGPPSEDEDEEQVEEDDLSG